MRAIDLCDILERNYKKGEFQCNMDSCGDKPCDLCTVEKFEKEVRANALKEFVVSYREFQEASIDETCFKKNEECDGVCTDCFVEWVNKKHTTTEEQKNAEQFKSKNKEVSTQLGVYHRKNMTSC